MVNIMPEDQLLELLEKYGYTVQDATAAVLTRALDEQGQGFAQELHAIFKQYLDSAEGRLRVASLEEAMYKAAERGELSACNGEGVDRFDAEEFFLNKGEGAGFMDYLQYGTDTVLKFWSKADGTDATNANTANTNAKISLMMQQYKTYFLIGIVVIIILVIAGVVVIAAKK